MVRSYFLTLDQASELFAPRLWKSREQTHVVGDSMRVLRGINFEYWYKSRLLFHNLLLQIFFKNVLPKISP